MRDSEQSTALMLASALGNTEIVNSLIAAGALLDEKSKYEETALFCATREDRRDSVKALIAAGADLNITNRNRLTPLIMASW